MRPTSPGPFPSNGLSVGRAFWFAAAITAVVFAAGVYTPKFIVDSWSYLELSNTIFKDFYRFSTLRQFESHSPYSNSFPPLWPILLALVRQVLDFGIYTGYLLNCFLCLGLLGVLIRLFQKLTFPGWVGAACYLTILGFPPFLWDALGAKTFPLSLTLLIGALAILFGDSVSAYRIALAGLLMGLACLNRFDALPVACVLGLIFVARAYRVTPKLRTSAAAAVAYFATLGLVLSPWVSYGMKHFGKPFPSDNVRQVLRADGGNVMDYYQTAPKSDLEQNPRRWLTGLVFQKTRRVIAGAIGPVLESALPLFLVAVLAAWLAGGRPPLSTPAANFMLLGLTLIPVILFPQALSGYSDSRYYSGPALLIFAMLFTVLLSVNPGAWGRRWSSLLLLLTALPLTPPVAQAVLHPSKALAPLSASPEMRQVAEAVRNDSHGEWHRLILTIDDLSTAKYGALTGEPITVMPRLNGQPFAAFARDWRVTHVYNPPAGEWGGAPSIVDPVSVMRRIETPGVELIPLDMPGLYRVRLDPPPTANVDYWTYIGSRWSPRVEGISLYRFHSAAGDTEAAGLAAGKLWQSISPMRILAQVRAEWPDLRKIVSGPRNPAMIVIHPNGRSLYTADSAETGTVSAFQIDPISGKLTMLNVKSSAGPLPAYVTIDNTGNYLLAANFGGTVAILPLDAAGRLLDAICVVHPQAPGAPQRPSHPHSVTMSPDNRFAIVADLGLDEILVYRFDPGQGMLTPNDPPWVRLPAGTGPRHFIFHPNGRFGYAIGETGSNVTALRFDAARGALEVVQALSTVPPDFHGTNAASELLVHPSGRFLYASNRGSDSIAVYSIDPAKGTLTPVQHASTRGRRPVDFRIDPTGAYLFAENADSDSVVQFRIDPKTGELAPASWFSVPSPVCLRFLTLPLELNRLAR
jgi:6-phosphogluconolactonase